MNFNRVNFRRLLSDARELYFKQFGVYPKTRELSKWAGENNLYKPPSNRRYLGFDNPLKTEDKPEYGYEVWVTVNEDEKEDDKVKFKNFEGGLYVVTRAKKSSKSLIETWQKLFKWLETSGYKHGSHQWFEEYITTDEQKYTVINNFQDSHHAMPALIDTPCRGSYNNIAATRRTLPKSICRSGFKRWI